MNKYYTKACNFYYGTTSKTYIKKKKSIPLNGYNDISFDKIEIINRKKSKIINLKDISKLNNKLKIKGRLGDIPALNIKKAFKGLNVIQVESVTQYVEYEKLVKFEIFTREKGYPNLAQNHKENNYPENFFESYKRYAKSLISVENFDGKDIDTNMDFELIFLDNPLKNLNESKRILLEYKNKILADHKVSIMSLNNGYFRKEYVRTNKGGYFDYLFKENTKYLIESVVIIEGSNKKKDNYAKWHSLWTSYTLKTPNK